jgi:hypothetical protein
MRRNGADSRATVTIGREKGVTVGSELTRNRPAQRGIAHPGSRPGISAVCPDLPRIVHVGPPERDALARGGTGLRPREDRYDRSQKPEEDQPEHAGEPEQRPEGAVLKHIGPFRGRAAAVEPGVGDGERAVAFKIGNHRSLGEGIFTLQPESREVSVIARSRHILLDG